MLFLYIMSLLMIEALLLHDFIKKCLIFTPGNDVFTCVSLVVITYHRMLMLFMLKNDDLGFDPKLNFACFFKRCFHDLR